MRSMTGFGVGEASLSEGKVVVEIRSLNHRFLETRVRLPSEIAEQTFFVEQRCRQLFNRGRFDVNVRLEGPALPAPGFDAERAKAIYGALCQLRDDIAPDQPVPFSVLSGMGDVLNTRGTLSTGVLQAALERALKRAIESLNEMRATEGDGLRLELLERLGTARELRTRLQEAYPVMAEQLRKRATERLERLIREAELKADETRLEAEIAFLADRADLAEELSRLASHFDQFASLCEVDTPVGRKLDFLLQEIGREANTIGAKCQDAALAHVVVELKAEIERMREQVQNAE